MELVSELMEKAARATPASIETRYAGWWLRHTDSETWWAGAVIAHGTQGPMGDRVSAAKQVSAAEQFYADHEAPPRFQICSACPVGLDALLADRGYITSSPMRLMTAPTHNPPRCPPRQRVMIRAQPTPTGDWVDLVKSAHPTGWQAEMRMISRVGLPSTFVTAYLDGVAVGTGRGVADSGATGVFHMATIPRAQGNAVAQTVLAAISEWASSVGAGRLYLQVDPTNVAASRLYVRAGFELLTDYAYRITAEDQSVPVPAVADDR